MSRIGLKPIQLPAGVEVKVDGNKVTVRGPRGELERQIHKDMKVRVEGDTVIVERPTDERWHRALHGLTRSLINNMVIGVTQGFKKSLELVGTGYRAQKQGSKLVISAGYSHPVEMDMPQGIEVEVPTPTSIIVSGNSKEVVGEVAAKIRDIRRPEPYLGKGIRYAGEKVRRKVGKAGK